ncbi:MAG: DUF4170 domain-containing protein [Hyphomicrobiales bacterium]
MQDGDTQKQELHLVLGGELASLDGVTFRNLEDVDIVGVFPDYSSARVAWERKARETIDNAQMRYFLVPLHRLIDPSKG